MSDAVLLPVYNEADTVERVLDAVREHFDGEIIIVDDGSTDGTHAALLSRSDITLIAHPTNLGYGRALAEGFAVAEARGIDRLVTMDCDGQHEPGHILEFLSALDVAPDADIISGSRYLPSSVEIGQVPSQRQEVNRIITAQINNVTGFGITDAFCGFKAYRVAVLHGLQLVEPGYGMPMEMWAKAHRAGLVVREIAVERIYIDNDRSFGKDLDDPERRLAYYDRVWEAALSKEAT